MTEMSTDRAIVVRAEYGSRALQSIRKLKEGNIGQLFFLLVKRPARTLSKNDDDQDHADSCCVCAESLSQARAFRHYLVSFLLKVAFSPFYRQDTEALRPEGACSRSQS